MEILQAAERR